MGNRHIFPAVIFLLALLATASVEAANRQILRHRLAALTGTLHAVDRLTATNRLQAALCLPLRNPAALSNLLVRIYDPSSPDYRRYLTPEAFTEQFGPTKEDYAAVVAFAQAQGLTVTTTHPNRMLVDIEGAVADFERAFHTTIRLYRHPRENRLFHAPDVAPSMDLAVPVLSICGLDDYAVPHPNSLRRIAAAQAKPMSGSAPGGYLWGYDFRNAYAPGVMLTGSGQSVGLLQFDGYYASDIASYVSHTGLPSPTLQNVLLDGFNGAPGVNNDEVALDIDMSISMAPGLTQVIVYEAGPNGIAIDILNRMATDNVAKQLSASWTWGVLDPGTEQTFQQFAAQGQSYFNASGDSDAYSSRNPIPAPADDPYITIVGGTTLTTGSGGAWSSEIVWNWGGGTGSGGGISTTYTIPVWQAGVNMTANNGSTTMRNIPDVAMNADNTYIYYGNGKVEVLGGTSVATPLWAGFTALINQQATAYGHSTVGFLNPPIYAIGTNASVYTTLFHDVTVGNNKRSSRSSNFVAVPGYDLCTGWGTPVGQPLINALAGTNAMSMLTLTVQSAHDGVSPGSTNVLSGTLLGERITNSPVNNGTTQYVCIGETCTGNSCNQISPTNVTLTLTNTATLTWNWQTQYLLTTATNGPGSVTPGGWYVAGSNATLTATPSANASFVAWSGDTNGCVIAGNTLTSPMTQARAITAAFALNSETLTVISSQNGANPGTTVATYGTPLSQWITNSPVVNGTTQYVCVVGTVAGNDFTQVSPTNVTLTLTNNATLTWLWTTNYWLATAAGTNGSVTVASGWQAAGATTAITATAAQYYYFTNWTGSVSSFANPLNLLMNGPESITANFAAYMTSSAPVPVPYWWLAQYGWTNNFESVVTNAANSNGMPYWAEYVAGTDPTDPASVLAIIGLQLLPDTSNAIAWPSVAGRVYGLDSTTNLLESFTPIADATNLPATPPINVYTNTSETLSPELFYRVRVWLAP